MKEEVITLFLASLHLEGLAPGTMKSYLAAVRYTQISRGLGDPVIGTMPRVEYILRGAKRLKPGVKRQRLPITPPVLRQLRVRWNTSADKRDAKMLWAACCLCFFGFLRSGEVVAPGVSRYDRDCHLCYEDIQVDNRLAPSMIRVRIKASKTDPFRQGVTIVVGTTSNELCPVTAVLSYMLARGSGAGPLFTWRDGRFLTRESFVAAVRRALEEAGLVARNYAGHSFRIGAATTAAQQGVQDSLIRTLGRWESSAYTRYIRTAPETLQGVAKLLVPAGQH